MALTIHKALTAPPCLSPREREVYLALASGYRNKEIANAMGVSVKTAATHRTRILEKLDMRRTADIVRQAYAPAMEALACAEEWKDRL